MTTNSRRFGMGALITAAVASAVTAAGGAWLVARHADHKGRGAASTASAQTAKARYQCPMHPTIVKDNPGDCPICGMKLVPMDAAARNPATPAGSRRILYYRSPMAPRRTSPTPQKDEMGMDFVPVYEGEDKTEGLASVEIDPVRQQLIGLTTVEVTAGPIEGAWRTVGRVAIDETRVRHVNVKVPGFVERIYVDFVGKPVRKGDPLFSVYSPELLSAQEEYLLALKTRGALANGGALAVDGDELVKAARRRLSLWDIPASEIERIEKTRQATKTLTFFSPVSGVVTKKDVVEGMKLDAGAMPYEIVDLSSVWVLADIYESELALVKQGMPATLTLNAFPDREFKGRIVFIDPLLDPQTRTVKVRLSFPNPGGELRPEMFGDVVLRGRPRTGLRIPDDAVVDSGTEKIAFVSLGAGKFQPRKLRLGVSDANQVEVLAGLAAGDRVVTRANFLIDSESRLRASLAEMAAAAHATPPPDSARVLPGAAERQNEAGRREQPPVQGALAGRSEEGDRP